MKHNSITALLKSAEKGNGYILEVKKVVKTKTLAFISVEDPERTVVMTRQAFAKIDPFIIERRI